MCRRLVFIAIIIFPLISIAGPGHRVEYDITIIENVRANYSQLASGRPDTTKMPVSFNNHFQNRYELSLAVTVLVQEEKYSLIRGDIVVRSVSFMQDSQEDLRRVNVFRQWSAVPFYFKVSPNGIVYAIQAAENSPGTYTNFLRDLLSQLQIVVPSSGMVENAWTVNQEYPDGIYSVKYEPGKKSDSFARTIINRVRQAANAEAAGTDSVTAWENTVSRSPGNLLASAIFFHKKFYQKLGTSILAYVERKIEAAVTKENIATENLQQLISQYSSRQPSINIYNPLSEDRRKILVNQGVLKKDTYETLTTQLGSVSQMDNEQLNLLISKFRALLFLQPRHLPKIKERLLAADPVENSFSILIAALIEVDTEPAQDLLSELVEKYAGNWNVLQRILPALGLRKYLSPRMEKTLLQIRLQSNDASVAGSAGLTLSNLCRSLADREPARADSIMALLVNDFRQRPKDKSSISRFLNETGNAGYSKAFEENRKYISDQDMDTRLRAWYSMRNFKMAEVDSLLASKLNADTSSSIQQRLLTLVHARQPLSVYEDAMIQVLKNTGNEQTIELVLIWLVKYANERELTRIRTRIRETGSKYIEEKFDKLIAAKKIP